MQTLSCHFGKAGLVGWGVRFRRCRKPHPSSAQAHVRTLLFGWVLPAGNRLSGTTDKAEQTEQGAGRYGVGGF